MLHPQHEDHLLTTADHDQTLEHANIKYPHIVPTVMKFLHHSKPFQFQVKLMLCHPQHQHALAPEVQF